MGHTTVVTTTTTTEIGTEVATNTMTETTATESLPHLRRAGEGDHTETEIVKVTDRQAMPAEAEAGAEGRVKSDHDVLPPHQTRRS